MMENSRSSAFFPFLATKYGWKLELLSIYWIIYNVMRNYDICCKVQGGKDLTEQVNILKAKQFYRGPNSPFPPCTSFNIINSKWNSNPIELKLLKL